MQVQSSPFRLPGVANMSGNSLTLVPTIPNAYLSWLAWLDMLLQGRVGV